MSGLNQLADMNQSPEEFEKADAGAGFNLIVPSKAGRKSGQARWLEFVRVLDAYRADEVGAAGQTRLLFTIDFEVIPGGDTDENVGRTAKLFLRLNPGFINRKRQEALGQGDPGKEAVMHSMAMKKIKQFMAALGLSLNQGVTADIYDSLFPEPGRSETSVLIGQRFVFLMKDNANKKTNLGENTQEPENILAAPKGA